MLLRGPLKIPFSTVSVSGCARAEHPFMPVRTSFHRLSRGGNTRRIVVLHGATVRQTADQQDWRGRVQAEEGQQRYTSRTTPDVTCVTRHAQNAKPTSRCRTVAPWSTTMRRVFHPETNGVKASPRRHKRVLSHGAPVTHLTHGISTRRPFHPANL